MECKNVSHVKTMWEEGGQAVGLEGGSSFKVPCTPLQCLHTSSHFQGMFGKARCLGGIIKSSFLCPLHGGLKMTAIHL